MARPRTARAPEKTDGVEAAQVNHAALAHAGEAASLHAQEIAIADQSFSIDIPYNRQLYVLLGKTEVAEINMRALRLGLILLQIEAHESADIFKASVAEMGILEPRAARRVMQVARKFGGSEHRKVLANQLGAGKVFALLAESTEDLEDLATGGVIAGHTADEFAKMTKREVVAALKQERDERADEKAADEEIIRKKDERINKLSRRATRSGTREQIKELLKDVADYSTEAGSYLNKLRQTIGTINTLFEDAGEQPDEDVTQALERATEFAHHWANELAKDLGD